MFKLFNSNTPEDKFKREMRKQFEMAAQDGMREAKGNDIMSGIFIEICIGNLYKAHMENIHIYSKGYNMSSHKTINALKSIVNEIRNKYLINPEPIT